MFMILLFLFPAFISLQTLAFQSPIGSHLNVLKKVRYGGGFYQVSDQSDNSSEDDDDRVTVDIVKSSFSERMANQAKYMKIPSIDEELRTQQSRSYFISGALFCSLALDGLLNKKKRLNLFPGLSASGALSIDNLVPSIYLTSGYILSAGIAMLLSYSLSRDQSKTVTQIEDELQNEATRRKLHLLLLFSCILNLCSNLNASSAPFFGMSGLIVNVHNGLIALSGWIKESNEGNNSKLKDMTNTISDTIKCVFRPADLSLGFKARMMSSLYMTGSIVAFLRMIGSVKNVLIPHYSRCLIAKSFSIASTDVLQRIGLEWAFLSRLVLSGGVCLVLKEEIDARREERKLSKSLTQVITGCALFTGIPSLFCGAQYFSTSMQLLMFGIITGISLL